MTSVEIYDVIVVGAGVMGSATAYTLANQGKKTLLVDQFPLPHTRGSSHGASRIIRIAYPEKFNTEIMEKAFPLWRELEVDSGMQLFKQTGLLCITDSCFDDLDKYHQNTEDHVGKVLPKLDQEDLTNDYPLMSFGNTDYTGCLDESAGTLFSDKCLQAFQRIYIENGGEIQDNCQVKSITPGDIIRLETDSGMLQAKGIILTCGAWASKLLEELNVTLPLQAIEVCYWKAKDGEDHSKMPCLIDLKETCIFGLPTAEYPGLMKICLDGGLTCDPDTRDLVDPVAEAENMTRLEHYITKTFPYLHPKPAVKERCIYTMTPDENCIIDTHPVYKNIVYAAGFSGMGFKQAPIIGMILADLVGGETHKLLVDELRSRRFSC